MPVTMQFCGAARTVTGSCILVRTDRTNFLVDCGMFQGTKTIRELNYQPFPFDVGDIDFVLLTHAHIDHSGLLPKLFKAGFDGPVYMTRGTRDLLSFMLPDSGHIQEREVEMLNRRNTRRGREPVVPIYTQADAVACQEAFRTVDYETWVRPADTISAKYWNAGHILGSASIEVRIADPASGQPPLSILFSGDIGPDHKLFHPDPEAAAGVDYLVCESTYGDRSRVRASAGKRRALLEREVNDALDNNGILLIPAFAVERTQELLADLTALQNQGAIPNVPIFLDSPMAIKATDVFEEHAGDLEDMNQPRNMFINRNLRFTETVAESKSINRIKSGAIIVAASGMCEAGRIRHHLKAHLWRSKATVLFVGYQANGTLGRLLLDGIKTARIHGEEVRVRARLRQIDSYSGHADNVELIDWIKERRPVRKGTFLTHGEQEAAEALRKAMTGIGFDEKDVFIPALDDIVDLETKSIDGQTRQDKPRLTEEAVVSLDWHNDLAQLQIDIIEAFDTNADKRSKDALLRRLRRALDENAN